MKSVARIDNSMESVARLGFQQDKCLGGSNKRHETDATILG
jgi:hypothetical protein